MIFALQGYNLQLQETFGPFPKFNFAKLYLVFLPIANVAVRTSAVVAPVRARKSEVKVQWR